MQLFVMAMTMAKGITMGAPVFGSPKDFISAMEEEGNRSRPMLTLMGLKPVKFQSESDFAKSLSTQSKVFSIYAVRRGQGIQTRDAGEDSHRRRLPAGTQPLVAGGGPAPSSSAAPGSPTPTPGGQQVATPGSTSTAEVTAALQP